MPIRLVDAARYYAHEDHQIKAWEYLDKSTPIDVLKEFAKRYRNQAQEEAAVVITPDHVVITPELMARVTGYQPTSFDAKFC